MPISSATGVSLSIGELIAVAAAAVVLLTGMGKLLVAQVAGSLRLQINTLQAQITNLGETATQLEREVESLNRQLPLEYVRREDWIRFSASIDAKLDRLAEILMRQRGHERD